MDAILKTACADNIKNSSFKNYKSISIKLFNIINKNDYNDKMSEEEIMTGFGKIVNKFETLQKYLEDEKNAFKTTTKKNYINNLLNVILKIKNIDSFCIKKKKKLQDIKNAIRLYWELLRKNLDIINVAKKNKQQEDNEIEKSNTESVEEEVLNFKKAFGLDENGNPITEEEKLQPIIEEPFGELTSVEEIEYLIEKKQIQLDLNMLEYQQTMLEKEKKCIEDKLEYIKNTIQYRKEQLQ
mgnify:CR=1 FL=1|jgi:hypothetical protein|tara:strand:- start:922 stop:1641 length:720 start_codon:yes stop_codon:yes gene_type:complete